MILSTTPQIEGHTIREYKGVVTGETIIGANMFKDLFAGIRDIVGGRAGAYEKVLSEAKDTSMQEMMQRAQAMGANAIVGIGLSKPEQKQDDGHRKAEHDVSDESPILSWRFVLLSSLSSLGLFVWQQVENHCRPAGISAPSSAKQQRAEYLGNGIVERTCSPDTTKQIIPQSLNLHILSANQSEEHKHICTYAKLGELPGVLPTRSEQDASKADAEADIREVQQEKQIPCRLPQPYGNGFEYQPQNDGRTVLLHAYITTAVPLVATMSIEPLAPMVS